MKREDLIKIIKLRSVWKIDKRTGNYKLPSGERLSRYITQLVESQMALDELGIRKNGELCLMIKMGEAWDSDYKLMPAFEDDEICSYEEQEKRLSRLVLEIVEP